MDPVLLCVVIGVIALVLFLIFRARKVNRERAKARDMAARANQSHDPLAPNFAASDPRKLKLGDTVEWPGDNSYLVRGTVTLTEDGYTWWEHFVDPIRGVKCYLSVSDEGGVEVVRWRTVSDADLTPGQRQVVYRDVVYTREERGTATYQTAGTTDLPARGKVEYADYNGPHGARLSFERFNGGKWEMSIGEVIDARSITIYPAS